MASMQRFFMQGSIFRGYLKKIGIVKRCGMQSRMVSSVNRIDDDPYKTRCTTAQVVKRVDPVVWSPIGTSEQTGPLTTHQLAEYNKKGYIILRDVFSKEELQPVIDEVEKSKHDIESNVGEGDDPTITDTNIFATEPETRKLRSIFGVHIHYEAMKKLSRNKKLVFAAKQILDDDVYVHQSRVNFHQALVGTGHNFHIDFEIFHAEDGMFNMRALTAIVLLSRNTEAMGSLMVIPGTQNFFFPTKMETSDDNLAKSSKYHLQYGVPGSDALLEMADKYGIEYCTGEVGDVVLFDVNLLHGNHSNLTPWDRFNYFIVYNGLANKIGQPLYPNAPGLVRPQHMAQRDPMWITAIEPLD